MLTFEKVKSNPFVQEFIKQTSVTLQALGYTDHGGRHSELVAKRAGELAEIFKLPNRQQALCQIAGYCHDMGSFMGRTNHHYWGALLFFQLFIDKMPPVESAAIMQAIAAHDKLDLQVIGKISAVLILADKSDVHRSRVNVKNIKKIKMDIHDRVNYSVTKSELKADYQKKTITLKLKVDTKFTPVMEYFEIFTERMVYCRQAAEYLGCKFKLEINNFKLL